ncbi:MAG: dihydroorotase [Planctomycetales bacterium]|nr:dihydroorotase [Planctomycetales bacterium]
MSRLLVRGGRIVDPSRGVDAVGDLVIEDGRIAPRPKGHTRADEVLDASGLVVVPGLVDMHVHFREPGREEEETIASGARAAVHGGFTTVACMPNTEPAVDNEASAEFVFLQAERAGAAHVHPIGAVTKGRKGEELAEIGQLARGGAVAFSDDGAPIMNAEVMRRGLEYAGMFGKPVISHCEDAHLSAGCVMHEGLVSTVLGLPGIPAAAEEVIVARDILLAGLTGGRLHIAHVSTAGSVELIRRGKARGVNVTAEVTPHHLTLTDETIRSFDPVYKMNPPLRTAADVAACREGLRDGTLDAIASDHAPHASEGKSLEFPAAPFGVIGLESTVPVVLTEVLRAGVMPLPDLIARMTAAPAKILGLRKGTLAEGADADVTLLDLEREWTLDAAKFQSRSRNCPFHGKKVRGRVVATIVSGKVFRLD